MKNRTGSIFSLLMSCGLLVYCAQPVSAMGGRPPTESGYFVRVALMTSAPSLLLDIRGAYRLRDVDTMAVVHAGKRLRGVTVDPSAGGIRVGDLFVPGRGVVIDVDRDGNIAIDQQRVRGEVHIVLTDTQQLRVINRVDLEDYLAAVLAREMPSHWPTEALKAQAIAARTYAMYQVGERAEMDYDVTGDVRSQVYGGRSVERRRTNRAVDDTRGHVLRYAGDILPAFFHSTCGGHTEAAHALWKVNVAPLRGRACPFDHASPFYAWEASVPLTEVARALQQHGTTVGTLRRIDTISWTPSGRLDTLRIVGADGTATMDAQTFRRVVGAQSMKSTLATIGMGRDTIAITRHGWGHGVGMCQWGAYGMARQGYAAASILSYYYPSAERAVLPLLTVDIMTAHIAKP